MLTRHIELFQQLADTPSAPLSSIEKGLLVLSTPRSGSTLFCDKLSRTGKIGLCEEWFNLGYMKAYIKALHLDHFDIREYLRFVAQKTVGTTGVFAVHAHTFQLMKQDELSNIKLSNMHFDFKVYIQRIDYAAQVVSMAVAEKTQQWRCDEKPISANVTLHDCYEAKQRLDNNLQAYHDVYARHIDATYVYESFSEPGHTDSFNDVLVALGKTPCARFSTTLVKQRNYETARLTERFRNDLRFQ